jgi:hypothetical protein
MIIEIGGLFLSPYFVVLNSGVSVFMELYLYYAF